MGKVRKIVYGGLLGLTVLSLVWINTTPQAQYKTEINEILTRRQQEWDLAQQSYANDPAQNIFLNADLHPSWALKPENIQPGELDKTMVDLIRLDPFDPKVNQDEFLARAGKTRADLQAARQKFRAIVPKIVQATNLPVFVAPNNPPGKMTAKTWVPNFIGIRRVALACGYEGSLEVQDGKPDEAVPLGMVGIKLGYAISNSPGVLIQEMIAVAVQSIGAQPLYQALLTEKLKPESLQLIIAELPRYTQPPQTFVKSLENEVLMIHNSIDDPATPVLSTLTEAKTDASAGDWFLDGVLRKTGLVDREMRMYDNLVVPLIQAKGDPSSLSRVDESNWLSLELSGKAGIIAMTMVPPTGRARYQFNVLRTRLAAFRIVAALQLYHGRKKAYPDNLDALKEVGLDPIPAAGINKNNFVYSLSSGQPALTLVVEPEQLEMAKNDSLFTLDDGKFQIWTPKR